MGGGNGAKAKQKRERNAKDAKGVAKSQLKEADQIRQNEAAKDIQCDICKLTFLKTTRLPSLTEHAQNKHNSPVAKCFPAYAAP